MAYWLMKSEPDELSIEALGRLGEARWDGVRNYQARNFLRAMSVGDEFFFYHSSCPQPGIAGIARITRAAYPDPTALDPQSPYYDAKATADKNPWSAVDVAHVQTLPRVLELGWLKQQTSLAELPLVGIIDRIEVVDGVGAKRKGDLASRIVFGPTCDSVDRIPGELMLADDIAEGDYLVIHGMGAYSVATNTRFNGFGDLGIATVLSLKV